MSFHLILASLLGPLILWVVLTYNKLVKLRERLGNAESQIDVQLKRRADLIPNLVETVKGYMKHERETLERIAQLRASMLSGELSERDRADKELSRALKTIFAVAESYPELKANKNFLALQEELTTTENRVAYARQAYNDVAYLYNSEIKSFPTNIIAGMFSFKEAPYLELEAEEVRVSI